MSAPAPGPASPQANPSDRPKPAGPVMDAVCAAALLVLGFVASVVLGLAAAWLPWLWASGGLGVPLAAACVIALVGLLYTGGRVAGWALESRRGPALLTVGWVGGLLPLVGYGSAGDVVMLAAGISYAYLFGGVTALALAAVLTEPGPEAGPGFGR